MSPLLERVLEPILLRKAALTAAALGADRRAELDKGLALARQKATAADVLASHGQMVEALRLQGEALAAVAELAKSAQPQAAHLADAAELESLSALGNQYALSRERLLNDELPPEGTKALERMAGLTQRMLLALGSLARSPAAVRWASFVRIAIAAVAVILVVSYSVTRLMRVEATASGYFLQWDSLRPANAVDGDPKTEWLLDDRQAGWLEVSFSSRTIHHVRFLNSKNRAQDVRSTRDYRIELWDGDKLKASTDGTMPLVAVPTWQEVGITADHVNRLRFVVKSFHNTGGGLAELSWD